MKTTFTLHEANQLAERGFTVMTSRTRTEARSDGAYVAMHKGKFLLRARHADPLGKRMVNWVFKQFASVIDILDYKA